MENRRNRSGKWIFLWIFCELGKKSPKKTTTFHESSSDFYHWSTYGRKAGWRWGGSCYRLNVNTSGQLQINLVHGKQKWRPKRLQNLIMLTVIVRFIIQKNSREIVRLKHTWMYCTHLTSICFPWVKNRVRMFECFDCLPSPRQSISWIYSPVSLPVPWTKPFWLYSMASNYKLSQVIISSWWFQPSWKILYSQNGNLPQVK